MAKLVTGKEGTVSLHNLLIGSYYLKETDVGNHHFVLDPEAKEFEIKYQGQEVAVDYVSMELENKRQKIELVLTKQSKETKEPVQGAVFGLYAEEDILDLTGEVIVKAGEFLAKAESAEDGTIRFDIDLPHGKYMVKELETTLGYLKTEETWFFDATYQNPELEVISLAKEIENQPTVVEITKTDITDDKEVEGEKLQILDKDGEIVEEWVSTKESRKVYALEPGEYILHEEAAPEGYLVVSDVPSVVEETGEIQKVEIKDERPSGQLLIQKTDAENKAPLADVEFELRNQATGEIVETLVTGEDGTAKSGELPIGIYEEGAFVEPIVYVLVETKPLEGYEVNTEEVEVVFEYQDDETKIIEATEEIENARKPGTPPPDAPKTGDDTRAWIPVVIMSAALLGAFFIVIRIRRRKR
ncbi:collagen binding domain-containing protein [Ruminococcus sp. Marseille-P328]|uniref:MSCRAMM family protein n=1 Tax=Ruminococcus sp. Marseille-P328 TaxID=1816688 RepID=UPI003564A7FC